MLLGWTYDAYDIEENKNVAIKVEKENIKSSRLGSEYDLYSLAKSKGIPKMFWFGKHQNSNVLVMELLGPNLELVRKQRKFGGKLSRKAIKILAVQLLNRIENLHDKGIIHRDLKPDNIALGNNQNKRKCYLLDFGLAKMCIENGVHIPYKKGKRMTGSARFCSIRTHCGIEQSRRDDLETLGYTLLHLMKGSLPWQNIKIPYSSNKKTLNKSEQVRLFKQKKYSKIHKIKQNTCLEELCKESMDAIKLLIDYSRQLKFSEKPDYSWLRKNFRLEKLN